MPTIVGITENRQHYLVTVECIMKKFTRCVKSALLLAITLISAACTPDREIETKAITFLDLTGKLPAGWIEETPSSSMRLAQLRVPGDDSTGDANLVVYYFGQGQGGTAEANIARWQSQFTDAGGKAVEPTVTAISVNAMPVTVVELEGSYARGTGVGPAGSAAPDQILLASIVESARGNVFIQLHGPAAAVAGQREAYMDFIRSIRAE